MITKYKIFENIEDAYDRLKDFNANDYCVVETKYRKLLNDEVQILLQRKKYNL